MFKHFYITVLLLLLPLIVVAQNTSREFSGWQGNDDGIHFSYPSSIADNVGARLLPAAINQPERVHLFFENYHGNGQWIETAAFIDVMPSAMLPDELVAFSASLDRLHVSASSDLQNQLGEIVQAGDLPIAVSDAIVLDFQTGFGYRFIAQVEAGGNQFRSSYRYVGKTTDNSYLIMALFPMSDNEIDNALLNELDMMIASLSVTSPDSAVLTSQGNGSIDYEGIHFSYDVSLAYRIDVEHIAQITGSDPQNSMFGDMPGYRQFSFIGYPVVGNYQSPYLYVMPVAEFPDSTQIYGQRLLQLQTLLRDRPVLTARAGADQIAYPILPVMNAAQTLVSQPQYMRFGNGEGLRYITYYSQSPLPLNATDLFYVYVGLSDDGANVVAAIFPLHVGFLPEGQAVYDIADYEQFAMNYLSYLNGVVLQTNVMSDISFNPQIHLLDEIINSLIVE